MEESNEQVSLARERTRLAQERNQSANERTFLAWMRTGLASVGGGIAIIRLLTFERPVHSIISQMIGSSLVLLGIFIFLLSYLDYRFSYIQFPPRRNFAGALWSISLITFVLIVISFLLLIIAFR